MDVKFIYVIIDHNKFTKDEVRADLKEEGYEHYFKYGNGTIGDTTSNDIDVVNEVWYFGNCENSDAYKLAKEKGKELWQMG